MRVVIVHILNKTIPLFVFIVLAVILPLGCDAESDRYMKTAPMLSSLYGEWEDVNPKLTSSIDPQSARDGGVFRWRTITLDRSGSFTASNQSINNTAGQNTGSTVFGTWQVIIDNPIYGAKPDRAAILELVLQHNQNEQENVRLFLMKRNGELYLWQPIYNLEQMRYQEFYQSR